MADGNQGRRITGGSDRNRRTLALQIARAEIEYEEQSNTNVNDSNNSLDISVDYNGLFAEFTPGRLKISANFDLFLSCQCYNLIL